MLDELLRQLGGLVLGSVPTMIIFLFLVFAYRFILYGALVKTLAERRARTTGALEAAHAPNRTVLSCHDHGNEVSICIAHADGVWPQPEFAGDPFSL